MRKTTYFILPIFLTLFATLFFSQSFTAASFMSERSSNTAVSLAPLTITETQKLIGSDGATNDGFGTIVTIDDNLAAISDEQIATNQGAVYIFMENVNPPNVWEEITKVTADDGQANDQFGIRNDINSDLLIVGAPFSKIVNVGSPGAVYVYRQGAGGENNWGQVDKLLASDSHDGAAFGLGLSIFENIFAIGSPSFAAGIQRPGQVYIFKPHPTIMNQWEEVQILTASDAQNRDGFGGSVAITDNLMVVGSSTDAAYIFTYNEESEAWEEIKRLTVNDTANMEVIWFGGNVAIDNDIVVVSGERTKFNDVAQGAVFIFGKDHGGPDNWGLVKTLTAESASEFGISLDLDGDLLAVSSRGAPTHVYQRNKGGIDHWGEVAQLTASDVAGYGIGTAVSGTNIMVGAHDVDSNGAAYFYDLEDCCAPLIPLSNVVIDGITRTLPNETATFTATISLNDATQPISYTWETTDHAPITQSNGVTDTFSVNWATTGSKTITVTAENEINTITTTHTLTVSNLVKGVDLTIVGAPQLLTPLPIDADDPLVFAVTVKNLGDTAVSTQTDLFINPSSINPDGIPVGESDGFSNMYELGPGESKTTNITIADGLPVPDTTHQIYAMIDTMKAVDEVNEGNNVSSVLTVSPNNFIVWQHIYLPTILRQ